MARPCRPSEERAIAKTDFKLVPQLAAKVRMSHILSGAHTQEALSAWLMAEHRCEISQGTISNWINGRVERIAPEKHYVLNRIFASYATGADPLDESVLDMDAHELARALGFGEDRIQGFLRGEGPAASGDWGPGRLPFKTFGTRLDDVETLFRNVAGVYLGHSYSLRNNGRITVSVLVVDKFDPDREVIGCTVRNAEKYAYRGFLTLLKNDLVYCLLEEAVHCNEVIQIYLTTPGTNQYQYLYGILAGISGERPGVSAATRILYEKLEQLSGDENRGTLDRILADCSSRPIAPADIDSKVEAIIRNDILAEGRSAGDSSKDDYVLKARMDAFTGFCDHMDVAGPHHPWLDALLGPGE